MMLDRSDEAQYRYQDQYNAACQYTADYRKVRHERRCPSINSDPDEDKCDDLRCERSKRSSC